MADTNKYQYFRLEKKHLNDVRYIFLKAFNKNVSLDYLTKKYDTSYLGINRIATIAYEGQKPVAFYGAIPQLFKKGKQLIVVAQACDSATLPQHQKQGLHFNLAKKSYEIMQTNGLKMVYGFLNDNSYHSTKKLHWKEHQNMVRFHIKTGAIPMAKVAQKIQLQNLYQRLILNVFKPNLAENVSTMFDFDDRFYQHYSKDYYLYKEGLNHQFSLSIFGCLFYVKIEGIMHVGYFSISDVDRFRKALRLLKKLAWRIGVSEILFQVDPGTSQFETISNQLNGFPSWLIGYLLFDEELTINDFVFNYADLDTF